MKKILFTALGLLLVLGLLGCGNTTAKTSEPNSQNDPTFTIKSHNDSAFSQAPKKIEIFGIPIYAVQGVEDNKIIHAANVMAQYLDNDEDGIVDNQKVIDAMRAKKAFLFMWKKELDLNNFNHPGGRIGQDLGADETVPLWHTNGHTGRFDASLEEVWHIITTAGHAIAYPNIFGTEGSTELTKAMDIARGGKFTNIPNPYPQNAWYTYDDKTCNYSCQASEYIYWAMSSFLEAQANRLGEIDNEWKLNTKEKLQATDSSVYSLLTDTQYKLPTKLPDGVYGD